MRQWIDRRNLENAQRFGEAVAPCPFCHHVHSVAMHLGRLPYVICTSCGAEGPKVERPEDGPYAALSLWNNRTPMPPQEFRYEV